MAIQRVPEISSSACKAPNLRALVPSAPGPTAQMSSLLSAQPMREQLRTLRPYGPQLPSIQTKPRDSFLNPSPAPHGLSTRAETRPAPPVYRPMSPASQQKPADRFFQHSRDGESVYRPVAASMPCTGTAQRLARPMPGSGAPAIYRPVGGQQPLSPKLLRHTALIGASPGSPPAFRPQGNLPAQAKPASAASALPGSVARQVRRSAARSTGAGFNPNGNGVIQQARKKWTQDHNYIVPEQPGWYRQHVAQRISFCVNITLKVLRVKAFLATGPNQAQLRRAASSFAYKAEGQVGTGNYGATGGKLDAAHFMNTTVRPEVLLQNQTHLNHTQEEAINDLKFLSSATTMQLKSNNVGPDKVIDGCVTQFTQSAAQVVDQGAPVPGADQLVQTLGNACLLALQSSSNATQPNYVEAIAGVNDALGASTWSIDNDVQLWLTEKGFL